MEQDNQFRQLKTQTLSYAELMLEHLPIGIALFDALDFRLLSANKLYHTYLNTFLDSEWQNGRTLGVPFTVWLPKAEASGIIAIFQDVRDTGIPYRFDQFGFSAFKQGITYWEWTIDPIFDNSGQVHALLQTMRDQTSEVLAQQKNQQDHLLLSQSHSTLEAERKRLEVVETIARSVRESLDIQEISKAALDSIFNNFEPIRTSIYAADNIQRCLQLIHFRSIFEEEQDSALFLANIPYDSPGYNAQAYKYHQPIVIEDVQAEIRAGIIKEGHPLAIPGLNIQGFMCIPLWFKDTFEGTLNATFNYPIQEYGPSVHALTDSGIYIAAALAHARLHQEVEQERIRLHTVLDQLPEGVLFVDAPTMHISYVNEAATTIQGVSREDMINMPLNAHLEKLTPTDLQGHSQPPEEAPGLRGLRGELVRNHERIITKPDGSKAILLINSAPIGINNKITGAVSVFQDITKRKSIEQQKNEFLSIASHELRTPITGIQGFAEILQMLISQGQSLNSPRALRAIDGIIEQSRRLTRLIEEMLDISRLEQDRLLLHPDYHDLLATISHVVETQSITSKHHQIHLILEGLQAEDTLMAYFDEDRIAQVFSNLISNAIKYSPGAQEIEVGIRYRAEEPDRVLTWVRDHGIGIATDELPYIFERFHRGRNLDRSISGLGIGLYLVKELIARHHGTIRIESSEGKGSTFFIQLLLKPDI